MEKELSHYVGTTPVGPQFEQFVTDVRDLLPGKMPDKRPQDYDKVFDSLRHMAGQPITKEDLRDNLWRLAGNLKRIDGHLAVPPWTCQPQAEWVPANITAIRRRRNNSGVLGYLFYFRILAGPACPMIVSRFWTSRFCYFLAEYMGFLREYSSVNRNADIPRRLFHHPSEFVTLRLELLLESRLSTGREPGFERVQVPPALLKFNLEQLKYRDRIDGKPYICPEGYPEDFLCCTCEVGYKKCRAGCHAEDYIVGSCPSCHNDHAWFDPELLSAVCVICYEKQQIEREAT